MTQASGLPCCFAQSRILSGQHQTNTALSGKMLDPGLGSCSQNTVQRGCPHRSRPGAPHLTDHLNSASGLHRAAPSHGCTALKPSVQTGPAPSAARVFRGRSFSPGSARRNFTAIWDPPYQSGATRPSCSMCPTTVVPVSITASLQDESPAPTASSERTGHSL